jgi:hypothetical protein
MNTNEKKSLLSLSRKILLIVSPIALLWLLELFAFPEDLFTFRVWDAIAVRNRNIALSGAFYPNRSFDRIEQGDLAPYSPNAVYRKVHWQTDADGFRNTESDCTYYPIVIVGDSFAVGTGLSQSDTLASVLSRRLKKCVYSFSTMELNDYLRSKRWLKSKPQIVIYLKSE